MNRNPGKLRRYRKTPLQAIDRFVGLPVVPVLHHQAAHEAGERGRQVLRDAIARRPVCQS